MFWCGNYIVVKEVKFLLKDENVTLSQVLEADDILQECKADNKALIWYLTQPAVLGELVSLITTEPPRTLELTSQYRLASAACEVLTSQLATLSDRLSADAALMHRLCDFINTEPPLNPLLASYFSKTIEMLLERSSKQDWYLYHIVCLRVLDFLKARRDFLPNLLRHLATSAIADIFKCFIRLDDLFNKVVLEWLSEHQILESLIQIICGTYEPEPVRPRSPAPDHALPAAPPAAPEAAAVAPEDSSVAPEANSVVPVEQETVPPEGPAAADEAQSVSLARGRLQRVAAANAAALLTDIILGDPGNVRSGTSAVLLARLRSAPFVRSLLAAVFTSPVERRDDALQHGAALLHALLTGAADDSGTGAGCAEGGAEGEGGRAVELAVAPHLPLLHQALLQPPRLLEGQAGQPGQPEGQSGPGKADAGQAGAGQAGVGQAGAVGAARLHVAALLALLAASEVDEVPSTMITLGTPGLLVDLMFQYPNNNFLHAQVAALLQAALGNQRHRAHYERHLLVECDLLTRLMDALEENESKTAGPRRGYMGHVIVMLRTLAQCCPQPDGLPPLVLDRWRACTEHTLPRLAHMHDTPLGGYYPSESTYEVENMAETLDDDYAFNDGLPVHSMPEEGPFEGDWSKAKEIFESVNEVFRQMKENGFTFDTTWNKSNEGEGQGEGDEEEESREGEGEGGGDSAQAPPELLGDISPWASASEGDGECEAGGEGWAQFGAPLPPPADPFAPPTAPQPARGVPQHDFWSYGWEPHHDNAEGSAEGTQSGVKSAAEGLAGLQLAGQGAGGGGALASNLLSAMSRMPPHLLHTVLPEHDSTPLSASEERLDNDEVSHRLQRVAEGQDYGSCSQAPDVDPSRGQLDCSLEGQGSDVSSSKGYNAVEDLSSTEGLENRLSFTNERNPELSSTKVEGSNVVENHNVIEEQHPASLNAAEGQDLLGSNSTEGRNLTASSHENRQSVSTSNDISSTGNQSPVTSNTTEGQDLAPAITSEGKDTRTDLDQTNASTADGTATSSEPVSSGKPVEPVISAPISAPTSQR